MTTQIRIEGREFDVRAIDDQLDTRGRYYMLTGRRGAKYYTQRNQHRPDHMFLINVDFTKRAPDVWLTDEGGELRVLS